MILLLRRIRNSLRKKTGRGDQGGTIEVRGIKGLFSFIAVPKVGSV